MLTRTALLPHQCAAIEKLQRIRVGALFMDMGTGKSRVAIELAARRQASLSRVLWFCPVSLKETIRAELEKHLDAPSLYVFDDDTTVRSVPHDRQFYVVGIESLSQSRRVLLAAASLADSRTMLVLDESTYIKGHYALRTRWLTAIGQKCRYRLILTGTPLTQGVQDLFAQMRFLSPQILGYNSFYSFAANHLEYSERFKGKVVRAHNTALIAAKIAPYTYQVKKEECLTLPEKLHEDHYLRMTPEQRDLYEQAKEELLAELDLYPEDWYQEATIYRLFTALQQIVCGHWRRIVRDRWTRKILSDTLLTAPHHRLDLLESAIDEIPPDEKVIVWAKYLRCIDEIGDRLRALCPQAGVETFCGRQTPRQREEALARWRRSARFLIATPSCGGHGLTLTEAACVVFYDNGFKFSERIQAEDRCHRIGQERHVTYIDLICRDSIDERIQSALQRKSNVLDAFREQVEHLREKRTLKQAIKEVIGQL